MLKRILLLALVVLIGSKIYAEPPKEGMWIPLLLNELSNIKEMQAMGLKLSAEDIYSVNNSSLKDAIVHFGGGCTGSMISPEGLLLTNHHCGYSRIQSHSSVDNDLLTNGFWAGKRSEELPNPGLTATFVVRIEDVTQQILANVTAGMTSEERDAAVKMAAATLELKAVEGTHYEASVKPFYYGNEYYMFVTETFKDVRLVGAPPSSIGKFGYDTDNWMWPRHTGDFAIFRVYANANNEPAEYSEDNVPYNPKKFLRISLNGVEEGDFTMVFGFPGRTEEYLTSHAVEYIMETSDPAKIKLREIRLNVIDEQMRQNDTVRIQYASKQSSISNAYKKWQGEVRGLKKLNAIEKKQQQEKEFSRWASKNKEYAGLLSAFDRLYSTYTPYLEARDYFFEAGYSPEIVRYASQFRGLVEMSESENVSNEQLQEEVKRLREGSAGFFKNYHRPIDREIFPQLLKTQYNDLPPNMRPAVLQEIDKKYKGNWDKYARDVFEKSIFADQQKMDEFLSDYTADDVKKLKRDPAFALLSGLLENYFIVINPRSLEFNEQLDSLNTIYMQALREMKKDKTFYPDANSTLRISYGKVEGYMPVDGKIYEPRTSLEGVIEKSKTDVADYAVPERLKELYQNKDYGLYGEDGKMPVAFIASNHTTGGNSGSPVLNGLGHLIGLNFDRNWEGTMSDIMYDPDQVRNISVDVRYILFVIDKFAGAENLIEEMQLVN